MSSQSFSRQRWLLLAAMVATLVVIGAGWWTALLFVSPQQVEAAAAAPSQPPLVATVERGDLVQRQTWPASVEFADEQSVPIAAPSDAQRSVVTNAPIGVGAQVSVGSVLLEVNGAPVFIFESSFPFYRDMHFGDRGPDVYALQEGLIALGLLDDADGAFGARTASAVTALYRRAGYPSPMLAESETDAASRPEADAATRSATYMPLAAVTSSTSLPSTVRSGPDTGALINDSTTVTLDSATAEFRVSLYDADDLIPGTNVTVTVEGAAPMTATVMAVETAAVAGPTDGGDAAEVSTIVAIIQPSDGSAIPGELVGRAATVVAEREPLAQDALLVPLSALAGQNSGMGTLLARQADGSFKRVRVNVIAVDSGMAAIEAADSLVTEGQEVRLG